MTLVLATLLATTGFPHAASRPLVIGPTNDWVPLVGGATKIGISPKYLEKILRAGFSLECRGVALNGWLIGTRNDEIYTNAHAVVDERGKRREPLDQCKLTSFVGLPSHIYSVWEHFRLGTLKPSGNAQTSQDRARIPLRSPIDRRNLPLTNHPKSIASIVHEGDELVVVSRRPPESALDLPRDITLIVQSCHARKITSADGGKPGLVFTDCDSEPGTSGALYFVRDKDIPGDLVPIAMAGGTRSQGNKKEWSEQNTSMGVLLDELFFSEWVPPAGSRLTIGPTSDWMPLFDGATKLGIDDQYVEKILQAGVAIECPGEFAWKTNSYPDFAALNGWLLGIEGDAIYTNAHGVITAHNKPREPFDQCKLTSFRQLATPEQRLSFPIDPIWNHFRVGSSKQAKSAQDTPKDRARIPLQAPTVGASPLPISNDRQSVASIVHEGDEVILVSRRPPEALGYLPLEVTLIIQACHVRKIVASKGSNPGLIYTDCDPELGTSGGLYFVRDKDSVGALVPVAMRAGGLSLGQNKPWSSNNTTVDIRLDEYFFSSWIP